MTNDTYEVKNAEMDAKLKEIGGSIAKAIEGTGWTFTFFLDEPGAGGARFYLSSAERDAMVKSLHEFIDRNVDGMPKCRDCGCASKFWEKNEDGVGYKTE